MVVGFLPPSATLGVLRSAMSDGGERKPCSLICFGGLHPSGARVIVEKCEDLLNRSTKGLRYTTGVCVCVILAQGRNGFFLALLLGIGGRRFHVPPIPH